MLGDALKKRYVAKRSEDLIVTSSPYSGGLPCAGAATISSIPAPAAWPARSMTIPAVLGGIEEQSRVLAAAQVRAGYD